MVSLSPKNFPRDYAGWRMLLASKKKWRSLQAKNANFLWVIRGHSQKAIITRMPCFTISWCFLEAKLSWNHVESVNEFMQMRKFDSEILSIIITIKNFHNYFLFRFFQMLSDFSITNLRSYSLNSNSQVSAKILKLSLFLFILFEIFQMVVLILAIRYQCSHFFNQYNQFSTPALTMLVPIYQWMCWWWMQMKNPCFDKEFRILSEIFV